MVMIAVFAPVLLGLVTLWLPRTWIERRMAVAVAGPVIAFVLLLMVTAGVAEHLGVQPHGPKSDTVDKHDDAAAYAETAEPLDAAHAVGAKPQSAFDAEHLTTDTIPWMPSLNIDFAFLTDGLGLFFGLLVSGIGIGVFLYARGYFGREGPTSADDLYRFYPTIGLFTTAMLGLVLADYTILTLLFWEMTSISSFLLIGWDRYDKKAVKLAMQAFFTTGLGGMGLFGGILVFGNATGYWRWSEMLANADALQAALTNIGDHPQLFWAFILMFIGAGSKSAQFPFHYWLPGAMAAPTPVSAFLHSATMVKAGVFLIGRLFPVFAALPLFPQLIIPIGTATMLYGGVVALQQHDLKRIFAFTTVSQLGLLMAMYGLGAIDFTYDSSGKLHEFAAIDFDVTQIANHAFYKAPLFITAGAIGHVLSRDITQLNGAFYKHKAICGTMMLAALGLAAVPGTISFQAKELFLYGIYHAASEHPVLWLVMLATVATAVCNVAICVRVCTTLLGLKGGMTEADAPPSDHHDDHHHDHPHEHGLLASMIWLPGLVIVSFQFLGGIITPLWNLVFSHFEQTSTAANYFGYKAEGVPSLWYVAMHPLSVPLWISIFCLVAGFFLGRSKVGRGSIKDFADNIYPAMYWLAVTGGGRCFRLVQTGSLKHYLVFVLIFMIATFAWAASGDKVMHAMLVGDEAKRVFEYWPGILIGFIACITAVLIPMTNSRIVRIVFLGATGFAVVALYLVYQAPDLALTQLLFEIISVILFVIVLRLLPKERVVGDPGKLWRIALATCVGVIVGWMTLTAASHNRGDGLLAEDGTAIIEPANPHADPLGKTLAQHTYGIKKNELGELQLDTAMTDDVGSRGGGGTNIVNVILVDFRGFDTLGEVAVLGLAAMGVWAMIPHRRRKGIKYKKVESDYPKEALDPLRDANQSEVKA
jgi:NADH:ubiquinone oxidoreductase subunit 5 (subunit L)/multisubunit Na+/H+ antiporter MnhA subunit/multisubunit Na+/H+ antiporter MnhB subunit